MAKQSELRAAEPPESGQDRSRRRPLAEDVTAIAILWVVVVLGLIVFVAYRVFEPFH